MPFSLLFVFSFLSLLDLSFGGSIFTAPAQVTRVRFHHPGTVECSRISARGYLFTRLISTSASSSYIGWLHTRKPTV
ncbi:hypothetical protein B0H13DRAFT_2017255 [Mycena leptocephala]|nr:hypothetical protein B0H13DRAFT_2017255 [Mycena leptocephala]